MWTEPRTKAYDIVLNTYILYKISNSYKRVVWPGNWIPEHNVPVPNSCQAGVQSWCIQGRLFFVLKNVEYKNHRYSPTTWFSSPGTAWARRTKRRVWARSRSRCGPRSSPCGPASSPRRTACTWWRSPSKWREVGAPGPCCELSRYSRYNSLILSRYVHNGISSLDSRQN